LIIVSSELTAK